MNLYEISRNYNNLQKLIDNPEIPQEMIIESLNSVGEEIELKAENIAKLIKNIEGDIKIFKEEEQRINERRKVLENKTKWLKNYLEENMKATGKTKFKHGTFSFNIQKNPPSLSIEDINYIPNKYLVQQEPKVDKKELLKDIKNGLEIDGVEIVQTESLRIR